MVTGIVLVNVERTMLQNVIDGLRKIKGIAEVYADKDPSKYGYLIFQ